MQLQGLTAEPGLIIFPGMLDIRQYVLLLVVVGDEAVGACRK